MLANPHPYIVIGYPGGTRIACEGEALATEPVVADNVVVDWGRDEYLSHSEPATFKFALLDRTGQYADKVSRNQLIGVQVQLLAEIPEQTWERRIFWGRITSAKARPDVPDPYSSDPRETVWRIEMTASDKSADLAQAIHGPGWWPEETAVNRAVRLRDMLNAANVGVGQLYFYPHHTSSVMYALEVTDRDGLSLLKDFYLSMGDTFAYLCHENNVRYVHRRNYAVTARLYRDADGVVRMRASDYTFDGQTYRGVGVEACEVTTSSDVTEVSTQSAITRVEMTWKVTTAAGDPEHVTVVVADDIPETQRGRRTLTLTSWLGDGLQVDPVCLELLNRGRYEGSMPRHPEIIVDTRVSGGFHSLAEAESLLMGGETQGVVYVSGSRYTRWSWVSPFYGTIGGRIQYVDGRWLVAMQLVSFGPGRDGGGTQVKWSTLAQSLTWGELSDSLTFYDAAFLTNGTVYTSN